MTTVMGALQQRGKVVAWWVVLFSPLFLGGHLSLALCPHFIRGGVSEHAACSTGRDPAVPAQNSEDRACCISHALKALPADGAPVVQPAPAGGFPFVPKTVNPEPRGVAAGAARNGPHSPRDGLSYLFNRSLLL